VPRTLVLTILLQYSSVVSVSACSVGFTPAQLNTCLILPKSWRICSTVAAMPEGEVTSNWYTWCLSSRLNESSPLTLISHSASRALLDDNALAVASL